MNALRYSAETASMNEGNGYVQKHPNAFQFRAAGN